MATYLRRSRPSPAEDCPIATILLLLWFLAGHPLALYADIQDDFDGLGGAEELTRKSRADVAAPLPDPLQAPDDEGRRLHAPWAIGGKWGGGDALADSLRVYSTLTLRRLSRPQSPPLLFPLQLAPPSGRDGEPPHAAQEATHFVTH